MTTINYEIEITDLDTNKKLNNLLFEEICAIQSEILDDDDHETCIGFAYENLSESEFAEVSHLTKANGIKVIKITREVL